DRCFQYDILVYTMSLYSLLLYVVFFFSSRRRHTRSKRDWSSDVCSSDLLEFYSTTDLLRVLARSSGKLEIDADPAGLHEIASRSRGTPRIANRLLRRVRDWAQVRGDGRIDEDAARAALTVYEVDELGLDRLDRSVLHALC